MTTVYLITNSAWEYNDDAAVFSSLERAADWLQAQPRLEYYSVYRIEVDAAPGKHGLVPLTSGQGKQLLRELKERA